MFLSGRWVRDSATRCVCACLQRGGFCSGVGGGCQRDTRGVPRLNRPHARLTSRPRFAHCARSAWDYPRTHTRRPSGRGVRGGGTQQLGTPTGRAVARWVLCPAVSTGGGVHPLRPPARSASPPAPACTLCPAPCARLHALPLSACLCATSFAPPPSLLSDTPPPADVYADHAAMQQRRLAAQQQQ